MFPCCIAGGVLEPPRPGATRAVGGLLLGAPATGWDIEARVHPTQQRGGGLSKRAPTSRQRWAKPLPKDAGGAGSTKSRRVFSIGLITNSQKGIERMKR